MHPLLRISIDKDPEHVGNNSKLTQRGKNESTAIQNKNISFNEDSPVDKILI